MSFYIHSQSAYYSENNIKPLSYFHGRKLCQDTLENLAYKSYNDNSTDLYKLKIANHQELCFQLKYIFKARRL